MQCVTLKFYLLRIPFLSLYPKRISIFDSKVYFLEVAKDELFFLIKSIILSFCYGIMTINNQSYYKNIYFPSFWCVFSYLLWLSDLALFISCSLLHVLVFLFKLNYSIILHGAVFIAINLFNLFLSWKLIISFSIWVNCFAGDINLGWQLWSFQTWVYFPRTLPLPSFLSNYQVLF